MATSMRGKIVDMEKLARQHELTPAVGNAKFNARGDKLGPNGQIIERREDMVATYYEASTKGLAQTSPDDQQPAITSKIKKTQTEE